MIIISPAIVLAIAILLLLFASVIVYVLFEFSGHMSALLASSAGRFKAVLCNCDQFWVTPFHIYGRIYVD